MRFLSSIILLLSSYPILVHCLLQHNASIKIPGNDTDMSLAYKERNDLVHDYIFEHSPSPDRSSVNLSDPSWFKHITMDFWQLAKAQQSNAVLQYLLKPDPSSETSITGVVKIDVHDCTTSFGNYTLLLDVIKAQENFQVLRWDSSKAIPPPLLQFLENQNPPGKIHHILNFYDPPKKKDSDYPGDLQGSTQEYEVSPRESMINSTALHALKATVPLSTEPNIQDMDLVFRTIESCPNLKELDLSVGFSGCMWDENSVYGLDFESHPGASFPPLEVLRIGGNYELEVKPNGHRFSAWEEKNPRRLLARPWKYLPDLIIDLIGYPNIEQLGGLDWSSHRSTGSVLKENESTGLTKWLEVMDWSQIHTLELESPNPSPYALKILRSALPSLQHLSLLYGDSHFVDGYKEFIKTDEFALESVSFRHIEFPNLTEIAEVLVDHHGSTLKSIRLTEREEIRMNYQFDNLESHAFFSISDLAYLSAGCPNLETLEIDIDKMIYVDRAYPDLDTETFNALAKFPNLERLVLRYESPDSLSTSHPKPEETKWRWEEVNIQAPYHLNTTVALDRFNYLREKKVGKELRELDVLVGNYDDRWSWSGMMGSPRRRLGKFTCRVDESRSSTCNMVEGMHYDWGGIPNDLDIPDDAWPLMLLDDL